MTLPVAIEKLRGLRFGKLRLVREVEPRTTPRTFICACDCGGETIARLSNLRSGNTRSCGCIPVGFPPRETLRKKHQAEYKPWSSMRDRCLNPRIPNYDRYGGRGITFCERWNSFAAFLEDMGPRPSPKHSIERMNNDGNYEPGNCRWATVREQANNRRSSVWLAAFGRSQTVHQWAAETGLNYRTITYRLRAGWRPEDILTKPLHH